MKLIIKNIKEKDLETGMLTYFYGITECLRNGHRQGNYYGHVWRIEEDQELIKYVQL